MSKRTCETCQWWGPLRDRDWGECRIAPPTPDLSKDSDLGTYGVWPQTSNEDWCGCHQPSSSL
jgi:hypothetical protein